MDSTAVVPPGWTARVDELGYIRLTRGECTSDADCELSRGCAKASLRSHPAMSRQMQRLKTDPARFEVVKNALTSRGRGDEDRPRQDRLFAAAEGRRRLFLRHLRRRAATWWRRARTCRSISARCRTRCARSCAAFPDVAPGDVFIHNDPYQGGSHLPDVNVVAPAFHDGPPARLRLRAGALAGYRQRDAGQLRRGDRDLWRGAAPAADAAVSRRQARSARSRRSSSPMSARPTERLGDLRAQVAANWRAAARLPALAAKYGTDTLLRDHAGGAGLFRDA